MFSILTQAPKNAANQTLIFITQNEDHAALDEHLLQTDLTQHSLIRCDAPLPDPTSVWSFAESFYDALRTQGFRYFNLCSFGHGSAVAQALGLLQPRAVRRLVLVNASCRLLPSWQTRIVDRIESALPLGLPLRNATTEFDSRPHLHRLVMPTLVILDQPHSGYLAQQFTLLSSKIPNVWSQALSGSILRDPSEWTVFSNLLSKFIEVPAKRPQKNLVLAPTSANSIA